MKKFIIKILCLILCMGFSASAENVFNIAFSGENDTVYIKGCLGTEFADSDIRINIERKNGTVYSCVTSTDNAGCYFRSIEFNKNLYDCEVYITCPDGDTMPVEMVTNSFNESVSASKLSDGNVIWVEGNTDSKNAGKTVNILLIKNGVLPEDAFGTNGFGHIGYCVVDSDGYYSYKFTFDGKSENYRLLTKIGNSNIVNSEVALVNESNMEISLNLKAKDDKNFSLSKNSEAQLIAFVKNKFDSGKKANLMLAFYDSNDKLIYLDTKMDFEIPFESEGSIYIDELTDFIPAKTDKIKLMVWGSNSLTPYGKASQYDYSEHGGKEFFVAPWGSDFNDGSYDKPLKTLRGARNAVRAYKETNGFSENGITVYFREGTYPVKDRVDFIKEDSGAQNAPVTYRAYENENVVFSGGIEISGSEFANVIDRDILDRLPDSAEDNIYCVDLKNYGLYDYGGNNRFGGGSGTKVPNVEVFYNDNPMVTARYPDMKNGMQQYLNVKSVVKVGTDSEPSQFKYSDSYIEKASDFTDVIVEGWFTTGYTYEGVEIDSVDKTNNIIKFKEHNQRGVNENNRYVITNFLEALDKENEYYLDRRTGMLYLYADENIASAKIGLSVYGDSISDSFIKTNDASYINFVGLNFELSRSNGIIITGGQNVTVDNCVIKNIGITGIIIGSEGRNSTSASTNGYNVNNLSSFYSKDYKKAYNHGIKNTQVYNTGEGALRVAGGDRKNLIPANHYIENCIFYDCNRFKKDSPIAHVYGMGIRVSNCEFSNSAMSAIYMGGNDIIIEYNEFKNCANDCADYGVIYSSTYTAEIQAGSEIRYNYFHDTPNVITPEHEGAHSGKVSMRVGVYNDFCDPFLEVHHNVFENMPRGIVNGGGYENNWKNNVFRDVYIPMSTHWNDNLEDCIEANGLDKMFYALSTQEYRVMDVDNGVWKEKYPKVSEAKAKMIERGEEAVLPSSTISDNVAMFISNETIDSGYNYLTSSWNYIDKIIARENNFFANQAKYMTIRNNDYSKNDTFDEALLERDIDLSRIGVQ